MTSGRPFLGVKTWSNGVVAVYLPNPVVDQALTELASRLADTGVQNALEVLHCGEAEERQAALESLREAVGEVVLALTHVEADLLGDLLGAHARDARRIVYGGGK